MNKLEKEVFENTAQGRIERKTGIKLLQLLKEFDGKQKEDIAVIGMAVKLPMADSLDEFWDVISKGKECIREFPENRKTDINEHLKNTGNIESNKEYVHGGFLEEIDKFDYNFFNITPAEAAYMNPMQRLFLQTVWQAIEHAGYGGGLINGTKTGVYVGYIGDADGYKYKEMIMKEDSSLGAVSMTGNLASILPSRISYILNLTGPSMLIDTACSSSMVSVHLACQDLNMGTCDVAIAGGVRVNLMPFTEMNKIGIESPDGRTRAFDSEADGVGIGEGVAAVLLKPLKKALKDRDKIYAVIIGSEVNQDGTSAGITAPNALAQADLINQAWKNANIDPRTISYIETHGTGTRLGDPIEIDGISRAFLKHTKDKQFCGIGSLKPNIGHLYEASGIVGMIKAILALNHEAIPPSINFNNPNQKINFENSAVYIVDRLTKWVREKNPRRCGVSAFGFSGTNAHIVLEEAPIYQCDNKRKNKSHNILTISARSKSTLINLIEDYIKYFKGDLDYDIDDVCYTANMCRGQYEYRTAFIFNTIEELKKQLSVFLVNEDALEEKGIYYNFYKLIRTEKERKYSFELTQEDIKRFNEQAMQVVKQEEKTRLIDEELCILYIKGAYIPWKEYYCNDNYYRVPVPVYRFERNRCWFKANKINYEEIINKAECFYEINWVKHNFLKTSDLREKRTILLLTRKGISTEQLLIGLKNQHFDVIKVFIDTKYSCISSGEYELENKRDDYIKLLHEIKDRNITDIIHMLTLDDDITGNDKIEDKINIGILSLYNLVKAINEVAYIRELRLSLLTKNANSITGCENKINAISGALLGFGRVISRELPYIQCKCVDIDDETDMKLIGDELNSRDDTYRCAYRSNIRYVEEFMSCELAKKENNNHAFHEEGTYVITGGTGDIGLEVANLISKKAKVNIALLSRSSFPDESSWDTILTQNDTLMKSKIKLVKEIKAHCSELTFYNVDVANYEQLDKVLKKLRSTYGRINGVFHCAGVLGHEAICDQKEESVWKVLLPKINGTYNLHRVTEEDNLDFLILFSSLAAIFCPVGQSSYAAANAYLNSFADYRNAIGKYTLSINWCMWQQTGMAFRNQMNIDTVFKSIDTYKALECLDSLMGKRIHNVIVGQLNYESSMIKLLNKCSIKIDKCIQENIENRSLRQNQNAVNMNYTLVKHKQSNQDNMQYDELENKVYQVCREAFGYEELDKDQSFFDLGADSIMLTRMLAKINELFSTDITLAKLFTYSTINKLTSFIYEGNKKVYCTEQEKFKSGDEKNDIAIIGMALKFPNAENQEEYWKLICEGKDCISDFSEHRKNQLRDILQLRGKNVDDITFIKAGFLYGIDEFDYKFYKLSPKEASLMDPNQRLFLQIVWKAIEDAGYASTKISGSKTGVYVGYSRNYKENYGSWIADCEPESLSMSIPGNLASIIPSRLSYILDLKGPSMIIDTACSSSLVAVHMACKGIENGDCDMAIAGGVKLHLLPIEGHAKLGIESSDYRTRAFSDDSDGTGLGEGIAAVILKPLHQAEKDHDHIYAIIKGSAINQDGNSIGITAPNASAQTDVVLSAWKNANVNPETITYIEAHGTGTKLGDPIEIEGLQDAFSVYTNKKQFCAVSTVKTNIGHLYEAAGIAGLIKATLSLKNKMLAPNIHFRGPNSKINFTDSAMFVNTELQNWEPECGVRRCGVSSFGISGTNCHVVLEEANEAEITEDVNNLMQLVTISAKSTSSLRAMIHELIGYLSDCRIRLSEICFTLNTGRNQYENRVAIIVYSIKELREKLELIDNEGLENIQSKNIFYGIHHVLSNDSKSIDDGNITKNQKNELNLQALILIKQYIDATASREVSLIQLAKAYVQGADIDWEQMYKEGIYKKISLPTYAFEKTSCWLNVRGFAEIHPLVEQKVIELMDEVIFKTIFTPLKHFVLSDHIILGNYVIPGTTYIEMAREISKSYFDGRIKIYDLLFFTPVVLQKSEERTVYSRVKVNDDFIFITFVSKSNEKDSQITWVKHAEVYVCKLVENEPKQYSLDQIKNLCKRETIEINQNELTKGFIEFGPRWCVYHRLHKGEAGALAELELAEEFENDLNIFELHPAIMDMATSAVILTCGKKFLPLSYKSIDVYHSLHGKIYSFIRAKKQNPGKGEIATFDVTLLNESGKVLVDIQEFSLKHAENFNRAFSKNFYYHKRWFAQKSESIEKNHSKESILVFKNPNGETEQLLASFINDGFQIITVECQNKFDIVGDFHYTVGNDMGDYHKLVECISEYNIRYVIHMTSITDRKSKENLTTLENDVTDVLYSIFYFVKTILVNRISNELKILILGKNVNPVTGHETCINPCSSALFGISNVITNECVNINCVCLDVDALSYQEIYTELFSNNKTRVVAYREGNRYQAEIEPLNIEALPDNDIIFRTDGCYVITGGTGGLGIEVAAYIAKQAKTNIALISRSGLPERKVWDRLLQENEDKKDKKVKTIQRIKAIENMGSNVCIYQADVSNYNQMASVLDIIKKKYIKINGIMHCAGIAGSDFIINKGIDAFERVIAPKIKGTWILDAITQDDNMDFFVLFSSVASLIAVPGQADYTAANAFMDSYALCNNSANRNIISINWPSWNDTGMAFDYGADIDTIYKPIDAEVAIGILDEILHKRLANVFVGELSANPNMFLEGMSFPFSNEIRKWFTTSLTIKKAHNTKQRESVVLKGRKDHKYTDMEFTIANIWGEVLGVDEVDIYENFYNLGGDSILAMRLINTVNERLKVKVEVTEVFEHITINDFAAFLNDFLENKHMDPVNIKHNKIPAAEKKDYYPISAQQQRIFMWNLMTDGTESTTYNVPVMLTIEGNLNKNKLADSMKQLIRDNECLRTAFTITDGKPVQWIDDIEFEMEYKELDVMETKKAIEDFIIPFDLAKAPLLRMSLIKTGENSHLLMFDIHHIIADGTSIGLLFQRLIALYYDEKVEQPSIKYVDYTEWQQAFIKSEEGAKQLSYWMSLLAGSIPVLDLPLDYARQSIPTYSGNTISFFMDNDFTGRFKKTLKEQGVTLFMGLLAVYNILLSKYTGQQDIIVGTPITGRTHAEMENVIGMFVNMLPLRNYPTNDKSFKEFLMEIKNNTVNAFENQSFSLNELINALKIDREINRNPLFDTMFVFQNSNNVIEISDIGVPKINIKTTDLYFKTFYDFEHNKSKFDISLEAFEREGGLAFYLEYSTELFKKETIEKLIDDYIHLLKLTVDNVKMKIGDMDIVDKVLKQNIITSIQKNQDDLVIEYDF